MLAVIHAGVVHSAMIHRVMSVGAIVLRPVIHFGMVHSGVVMLLALAAFTMIGMIHCGVARMLVFVRALFRRQMAHCAMIDLLFLSPMLRVVAVAGMILRSGRGGSQSCTGKQHNPHQPQAHFGVPSGKGRTVTTCIMPACMW